MTKQTFLEELKEACDEATDGPWESDGCYKVTLVDKAEDIIAYDIMKPRDGRFIAKANPKTVRWLLDMLREAQGLMDSELDGLRADKFSIKCSKGPNPQRKNT